MTKLENMENRNLAVTFRHGKANEEEEPTSWILGEDVRLWDGQSQLELCELLSGLNVPSMAGRPWPWGSTLFTNHTWY